MHPINFKCFFGFFKSLLSADFTFALQNIMLIAGQIVVEFIYPIYHCHGAFFECLQFGKTMHSSFNFPMAANSSV